MQIFVYGTLKKGYWNHEPFMGDSPLIGTGRTRYKYMMLGHSVPMIIPSKDGKAITGEVYDVDPSLLPRLDQLERGYNRVRGEILMDDGSTIWASYYIGRGKQYWLGQDRQKSPWDKGDKFTWSVDHGR